MVFAAAVASARMTAEALPAAEALRPVSATKQVEAARVRWFAVRPRKVFGHGEIGRPPPKIVALSVCRRVIIRQRTAVGSLPP